MIYVLGLIMLFGLMAILGNIVIEGIFTVIEKRKPDFIRAFKE